MDFEKLYKEALERARQGLRIDEVFPELKESEDERIRKAIITYLSNELHNITQLTPRTSEFEVWIAYLEKQKEQSTNSEKPKEWSEEDEKVWQDIFDLCNRFGYDDACRKLKSLRPQPHWKPSKEQISALERAIIKIHTPTDIGILAELRDNLKKLQL